MRKSSCKIGVVGYFLLGLRSQIPYVMIEKIFKTNVYLIL